MNHWRIIQTIYCSLDFSHLLAQHYDGWMTSWRGLFSLDPEPQTSTTGVAGCSQALSWFWMNRLIWIWMNCRNSSKFLSECSILDGFLKDQGPKIAISKIMFFLIGLISLIASLFRGRTFSYTCGARTLFHFQNSVDDGIMRLFWGCETISQGVSEILTKWFRSVENLSWWPSIQILGKLQ